MYHQTILETKITKKREKNHRTKNEISMILKLIGKKKDEWRWKKQKISACRSEDKFRKNSPPSSSESDIRVSCMASGVITLYFSSVVVVVVVVMVVSVTIFRVSTMLTYPNFCAMLNAVCPYCRERPKIN